MSAPCTDLALERDYVATLLRYPDPEHIASPAALSPLDCASAHHARILGAIHALASRPGSSMSAPEIATELEATGGKASVEALRDLTIRVFELGLPEVQAPRLRALAAARRRREALLRAVSALENGNADAEAEFLAEAGVGSTVSEHVRVESLADSVSEAVRMLVEAPDRAKWRTGFPVLDAAVGGMPPGTMHVIGGRTGAGKSSLALAIAMHQARNGLQPGIVSCEDAGSVWGPRGLAHVCEIDSSAFFTGRINRDFERSLDAGTERLRAMPISMAYALNRPLADVLQAIRSLVIGRRCNAITVDYLQAISTDLSHDRKNAVADAAKRIKGECQNLGVACTLLSQLSRPDKAKPFSEPYVTDLKESGDIENIAEVITLLWKTGDSESARVFGKVSKVKWAPGRPRFEAKRSPSTGAVTALEPRDENEHGGDELPDDARRYQGGRPRFA